ncbi:MAG: hypothetical protein E7370_02505 [Clostridiales bacterium]|nr:hypothetical protein [Clostridiales bacterium]
MKVVPLTLAFFIILINVLLLPANNFALANDDATAFITYGKAESKNVYLCSKPDEAFAMFTIPYTYCVEILGEEGDWYRVKYAEDSGIYRAVYGYCQKGQLTLLYERPQTVYLYKPITVTYSANLPSTNLPVLGEITVTAAYYGAFYQGPAAYSYVLCEGTYGYIVGANDDYPLIYDTPDTPAQGETPKQEEQYDIGLLVGVFLVIFSVVALLLLFFGNRKKTFTPTRD